MYIVINKNFSAYDSLIKEYTAIHAFNTGNAKLSITPLINNNVLIKVKGLIVDDILGSDLVAAFSDTDSVGRLAFYELNKIPEEITI